MAARLKVDVPHHLYPFEHRFADLENGLGRIADRPAFFPWGVKDFALQEGERKRFEEIFPNHQTLLLETSHFWQEDAGIEAAEAILEWTRG